MQETIAALSQTSPFTINSSSEDCPVCGGSGLVGPFMIDVETHPNGGSGVYSFQELCPVCHNRTAAHQRKRAAMLEDVTMEDFDWTVYPDSEDLPRKRALVEKYIERYGDAERRGYGLYISSATAGSGKTHLAQCIAGELLERWTEGSARLVTEADLLEISRQKPEDGTDALSEVLNCRLLILDDLGAKSTGRAWLDDVVFRTIDRRYRCHRVTMITSNLSVKELKNTRIADRIAA